MYNSILETFLIFYFIMIALTFLSIIFEAVVMALKDYEAIAQYKNSLETTKFSEGNVATTSFLFAIFQIAVLSALPIIHIFIFKEKVLSILLLLSRGKNIK